MRSWLMRVRSTAPNSVVSGRTDARPAVSTSCSGASRPDSRSGTERGCTGTPVQGTEDAKCGGASSIEGCRLRRLCALVASQAGVDAVKLRSAMACCDRLRISVYSCEARQQQRVEARLPGHDGA